MDEVFINIPESEPYPAELLDKFIEMGVVVHMKLAKSQNLLGKKQFVEHLGTYTVLTTSINSVSRRQIILKRMMDIAGGLAGCIITGILCIFVGPAIYIQSPGPIFFKQTRVGKNGKMFQMYKFRSMYMDAEERKAELMKENRVQDGMMFKLDFDPRIIGSKKLPDGTIKKGVGNFIRDWSLDEFPQFLNVLKGDMSLVGTRPPTVDEWDKPILVLSDISYVLYLTHQFIGFGIIYNMENGGIIGEKWIIIPMLHACLLALFLHYVVEANINKKIKKLCKRLIFRYHRKISDCLLVAVLKQLLLSLVKGIE